LNIFNAAIVTPTYYVYFTSSTILTSAILFQGFSGSGIAIATLIMGFIQICTGVILLQLSKSAKDVPDVAIFKGDLDQIREVSEQEQPETEPKADAIRGTAAIIRRISLSRQKMEQEEARRFFKEREEDQLKPAAENEIIEWDGLRRRKTVIGEGPTMTPRSRTPRSPHPPWGMSRLPDEDEELPRRPTSSKSPRSFLEGVQERASTVLHPSHWKASRHEGELDSPLHPVALTEIGARPKDGVDTAYYGPGQEGGGLDPPFQHRPKRERSDTPRSIVWADEAGSEQPSSRHSNHLTPDHSSTRRQFSFQRVFHRRKTGERSPPRSPPTPPHGILKRSDRPTSSEQRLAMKSATEEERLGLVKGDSRADDSDHDEKLDGSSSPSEDALEEPRKMYAHPQASTASSMSTTAFPPYEDVHPHHIETDSPFSHPPFRRESLSENNSATRFHSGQAALRHAASHHSPGRANTLPTILAEEPPATETMSDQYVQVEPEHADSSPELRVASLSPSPPPPSAPGRNRGRRRESWRRDQDPQSDSSGESGSEGSRGLIPRGAFI
jgi:magnesium transporter